MSARKFENWLSRHEPYIKISIYLAPLRRRWRLLFWRYVLFVVIGAHQAEVRSKLLLCRQRSHETAIRVEHDV